MRERFTLEREIASLLGGRGGGPSFETETFTELDGRLKHLSFLPHFAKGGTAVAMTPAEMDPGFYSGTDKFILDSALQPRLEAIVKKSPFRGLRIALTDLSKDVHAPRFAGTNHQEQVYVASVSKIAALYAAFQLQHDIRVISHKNPSVPSVFDHARHIWAETQSDPGGAPTPFTKDITLRGKVVLVRGKPRALVAPRTPRLDVAFASQAKPFAFSSATKTFDEMKKAINDYGTLGKKAIDALAFTQRLMVVGGGLVPASNYGVATIIRDVGFPYMASALIQSGIYDPARGGGLWLGRDYDGTIWSAAPAGGPAQSGTAASLATFMTLAAQGRLVSPTASRELLALLDKDTTAFPTLQSPFENGVEKKFGAARVFEKIGVSGGTDECAFIEWPAAAPVLKYVAIGLRSSSAVLEQLIVELHRIVAAGNGVTLPA